MTDNSKIDIIVEAFIENYGIEAALEDIGVNRYQKTNEDWMVSVCPFHEDNKPSFSMNLSNGAFICFACGVSGGLHQFIELSFDMNWKQANDYILARSGLSENLNIEDIILKRNIRKKMEKISNQNIEDLEISYASEEMIERMYQEKDPNNYLKNRGFDEDTINYFECGYTKDWYGKGYKNEERIAIPVSDEYGKICGFLGRTPTNAEAKYINTANLAKSHVLFNLHRASKHAKNGLILVEGSLDAMRLHQLGYPNVVAILGARLSERQLNLLKKYTNKIYLMFDSDDAGKHATETAFEMTKDIFDVTFIPLKEFKDPGEIPDKETLNQLFYNGRNWYIYNIQRNTYRKLSVDK